MTTKQKRERRGKCAEEMSALVTLGLDKPENRTKFDAFDAEQKQLKEEIDREENAAALEAELRTSRNPTAGREGQPTGGDPNNDPAKQEERFQKAFFNFLREGMYPEMRGSCTFRGVSEEDRQILMQRMTKMNVEQRDMGTGGEGAYPGATTGFFVPVGFTNKIEQALKYYGDMWNSSSVFDTTTGQPLPYPTSNDTTVEGEILGENSATSTTGTDVNLSQIIFGAYKFSTKLVRVSIELLQDSAFDLETFLVQQFGIRLGRRSNRAFTTGAGTTEPFGIMTQATQSTQTVIGDDNATTPDPTTQVGYIDLVNLEHQVDPLYRRLGSKWMFHDSTLRYFKTLKDKYGRPLWMPGMSAGADDTILSYGYSINNDMAQLGPHSPPAVAKTVAFGPLNKYMIRRVKEMAVLRLVERFAEYGQVAFLGFARYDGNLLDAGTHPIRFIQNASS